MIICGLCKEEVVIGDWPADMCRGKGGHRMKHHHFTPVEVDLGKMGKHVISGIEDAKRLEKMAAARGEEISFRSFNMEPSNYDQNSMGPGPTAPKFDTRNRRGVPYVTKRGGDYKGR